jgi:hypothetical protein
MKLMHFRWRKHLHLASQPACSHWAKGYLVILLVPFLGLNACHKHDPERVEKAVPTRCHQEAQDCPDPGKQYCSAKGLCTDHPTGEGCPPDWSWFKPRKPLAVKLPQAIVTWAPTLPSRHNPSLPCARHPALKDYYAWARDRADGKTRTVAKAFSAIDATDRAQRDTRCPSTFWHARKWLLDAMALESSLNRKTIVQPKEPSPWKAILSLARPGQAPQGNHHTYPTTMQLTSEEGAQAGVLSHGLLVSPTPLPHDMTKKTSKQYPAVLLLHGHRSSANKAFKDQGGAALVQAGFVVLALDSRPYLARSVDKVCELYLADTIWTTTGIPMLTLQTIETLASLATLRKVPNVDETRILIHTDSGGVQRGLAAAVAWSNVVGFTKNEPFMTDAYWPCPSGKQCTPSMHCTTVPGASSHVASVLDDPRGVPFPVHVRPHRVMTPEDTKALIRFAKRVSAPGK